MNPNPNRLAQVRINRRSFIGALPAGLFGLAASVPLWSHLLKAAMAQEQTRQRFVVWYTADGTVPEWFWANGAGPLSIPSDRTSDLSGSDFNQSISANDRPTFLLQPISAYADRALLVRGLRNPGQGDHAPAVRSMLTGEALSGEQDLGTSPSVDTVVGDLLLDDSHIQSVLRTGVYGNRVSYNGTRDVSRPEGSGFIEPSWQPASDARQVLDAVGGLDVPGDSGNDRAQSRLAVLGSVQARIDQLRCAAGSEAALRLEAYLEEIQRLEQIELEGRDVPAPDIELLDPDADGLADAERDIRGLETTAPFVRDLAVTSLALNYSPVVTIQWGASGENKISGGQLTDYRYDFLPDLEYPGAGDHGLAHPEDGAFQEAGHNISAEISTRDRVRIQRWFHSQLASLLERLDGIPDVSGSVLDNTTILCVSEFGGPRANSTADQHSTENLPFLLIGGANTPFATGQQLEVDATHGDYLLTVARAYGSTRSDFGVGRNTIDGILRG